MHGKATSLERIRRNANCWCILHIYVCVYVSRDLLITCQQAHVVVDAAMIWAYVTNVLEIALIRHCHGASLRNTITLLLRLS